MAEAREKTFKREICGKGFTHKRQLKNHFKSHFPDEPENQKQKCEICGKMLSSVQRKTVHMKQHTGERPYKCDVCGKSYCDKGALKKHIIRHSKKFTCEICDRPFGCRSALTDHMPLIPTKNILNALFVKCYFLGKTIYIGI
uniref:zinc finger protein 227-like n=1 Tax=Styela clava TaxID=7725 RepID=UPI0019399D0F|nr:zinc finger protein 227-like [Styela clava]